MNRDEVLACLRSGYLAFFTCDHGQGPEVFACSVRLSKTMILASCVHCARAVDLDDLEWLTPQTAAARYGWEIVADEPDPSQSGRVQAVNGVVSP